ncbi:hypothetical protein Pan44_02840 [Caulifigura coniformis]|uniref:Uncharacterized protein n=1 Tax=Caulifigura coniformis TaxID=2527983 RepID=A0A517S818_9PLAN|nr:hypothetical protein Pan44_02840 [Caulifigura coniformis]
MHRRLKVAAISALGGSIVAGVAIAAEPLLPPSPGPQKPLPGPSHALFLDQGRNPSMLIPPATGNHEVLHPLLIGPPPPVAYAGRPAAVPSNNFNLGSQRSAGESGTFANRRASHRLHTNQANGLVATAGDPLP